MIGLLTVACGFARVLTFAANVTTCATAAKLACEAWQAWDYEIRRLRGKIKEAK